MPPGGSADVRALILDRAIRDTQNGRNAVLAIS